MKHLLAIILVTLAAHARADMGSPSIQAVCKVTTADGKTYEGYILLIGGDIDGGTNRNGFYVQYTGGQRNPLFFEYDFHKLTKTGKSSYEFARKHIDGSSQSPFEATKVSFLVHTRDDSVFWYQQSDQEIKEKDKTFYTTKTIVQKKYEILDVLPLFAELPEHLEIGYSDKKTKRYNIPMKDIVSIEILWQPSKAILDEIARKTKVYLEAANAPDSTGDYILPVWIHEIVKKPEELSALKKTLENYPWK